MSIASYNDQVTVDAKNFKVIRTLTSNGHVTQDNSIAAAKSGSLSTRSSASVGTLTMASGHGFTNGQRLDIYWSGGSRYGCLIGTVATNSVPFTLGTGTDLPAQGTAITAMVPVSKVFIVGYATLVGLFVGVNSENISAMAAFVDSGDAAVVAYTVDINTAKIWDNTNGAANPFGTTNVAAVYLSHSDALNPQIVNAVALVT